MDPSWSVRGEPTMALPFLLSDAGRVALHHARRVMLAAGVTGAEAPRGSRTGKRAGLYQSLAAPAMLLSFRLVEGTRPRFSAARFGVSSAIVAASSLALPGCTGSREGGFDSPVPGARIDAIEEVAREYVRAGADRDPRSGEQNKRLPDLTTRRHLVESLRSDDPLVRFMAIGTLSQMAGGTKGYRHDDPEAVRALALPAWHAWATDPLSSDSGADLPSAAPTHAASEETTP
jgi:hypothetical protein